MSSSGSQREDRETHPRGDRITTGDIYPGEEKSLRDCHKTVMEVQPD